MILNGISYLRTNKSLGDDMNYNTVYNKNIIEDTNNKSFILIFR